MITRGRYTTASSAAHARPGMTPLSMLQGEALTLVNIERQVLPCAKAPASVCGTGPPADTSDLVRMASRRSGSAHPPISVR